MLLRALLACLVLPGVVAFAIPLLLVRVPMRDEPFIRPALVPIAIGVGLLLWCVREFYAAGKGTLAPWDPPRHLVTTGPYRFSRNPIYLGVPLILAGWAIGFSSPALWLYTAIMIAIFHVRVAVFEEPSLARRHRDEWARYAARVPRWIVPSRRAVAISWLAVLVALPIGGLIYEAIADGLAQREFPPPGQLVDVGGRRLHVLCIGKGEPVVVFESSGWAGALSAASTREAVAAHTTVCSYDRRGHWWSDGGGGDASIGDLARDLAVLQDRARVPSPVVVVASSIGGLTAEMFAREYPERVAGIVLVDAANSLMLPSMASLSGRATISLCTATALAHFGVVRLLDPFGLGRADEDARRIAAMVYNPRPWREFCGMAREVERTLQEFERAPTLREDLPLMVLSASSSDNLLPTALRLGDRDTMANALWDSHRRFADTSTRGAWQIVPDSTHLVAEAQPDVVADAVLGVLEMVK